MNKEEQRKEMLKKHGYLTVNKLIEKLKELQVQGHGDDLVGNDCEHYQFCDYDEDFKFVVVC